MNTTFTLSPKAWFAVGLVACSLALFAFFNGKFPLAIVALCTAGIAAFVAAWLSFGSLGGIERMKLLSIRSVISDIPSRIHWTLLHAWNVIYLRRWLVIAVVLGFVLLTVICCLTVYPIYSSTCIVRMGPAIPNPDDY